MVVWGCRTPKDEQASHHPLFLNTLKGHGDVVHSVAWNADGTQLATACEVRAGEEGEGREGRKGARGAGRQGNSSWSICPGDVFGAETPRLPAQELAAAGCGPLPPRSPSLRAETGRWRALLSRLPGSPQGARRSPFVCVHSRSQDMLVRLWDLLDVTSRDPKHRRVKVAKIPLGASWGDAPDAVVVLMRGEVSCQAREGSGAHAGIRVG